MLAKEFIVGTRQQQAWGWKVILALFLTGCGSGLFFIALIPGFVLGMVIGGGLVLGGCLFLLGDLSRPWAAWRLPFRPQSSWMARGVIGITAFFLLALAHIVSVVTQPNGGTSTGTPWISGPSWAIVLGVVAGAAALFVAAYPGFLIGNMRPISLWNSAYLPALFLTSALLGGLGILQLLPLNLEDPAWLGVFLRSLGMGLAILELLLLLGLILLGQTEATGESVRLLTHGPLRFHFLVGLLGMGLILPLVILGLVSAGWGMASLLLIEGVLHVFGTFLLRFIILRAGVFVSPVSTVSASV